MKANQATHAVGVMCRVLKISRSGFYAWRDRPMSARARMDLWLTGKIEAIHRRSRGAYGSPMIHAELADDHDIRVGRKRVARLMQAAGLRGASLRRFVVTTTADPRAARAVDLVERCFYSDGPDRLWVADITYIPTWTGFLYLAMVLDVYSRRIVGWAMETHLKTELILSALEMALAQRRPQGVIHHSDRGCQYTSYAFGKRCREAGVMPSMGSVGDAYGRVDDWRGKHTLRGVAVFRQSRCLNPRRMSRFQSPLVEPDVQISRIRLSRMSLRPSRSPRLPDCQEVCRGRAPRTGARSGIGGTLSCLASLPVGSTIAVDGDECSSGSPGTPG